MKLRSHQILLTLALLIFISGLVYIISSLLLYSFGGHAWQDGGFPMLANMRIPAYADLRWVTANSACGVDLNDLYHRKVIGCDAFGRGGIGYPPMSIWLFRLVNFHAGWTNLFALGCGLSFIGITGYFFHTINKNAATTILIGGLLLWGYPVQLALERLNIDVIVYILVVIDCYLLSISSAPWRVVTSLAIVTSTVGMKLFPLFGYLGLLFLAKPFARKSLSWLRLDRIDVVVILVGCMIALITATPVLLGGDGYPAVSVSAGEGGVGSHGLKAFSFLNKQLVGDYGQNLGRWIIRSLFILKIISLTIGFITTFRFNFAADIMTLLKSLSNQKASRFATYVTISMTCMWLGCYITTISYDYRFIFLIPLIAILAQTYLSSDQPIKSKSFWAFAVTIMAIIPGISTIYFMGAKIWDKNLIFGHELIIEFIMIPIVAGATAATMIQFFGLPSFLNQLRSQPTPAPTHSS